VVQVHRVYVIQVWFAERGLVLRLRGSNVPEPKYFRSWAELLLYLNTDLPLPLKKSDQEPGDPRGLR
jgi:hypothetical protein